MILGNLTLENFSVYGKAQSINLAPKDSEHPIVLVGGLNGAGKTSLLTAVRVALFGKRIVQLDSSLSAYSKLLRGLMHDQQKGETSVELSFDTYLHGNKDTYTIRRSWRLDSLGKISEKFVAVKNGKKDKVISSTWEEFIDAFIPVSIANLFFFDGEVVAEMANSEGTRTLLRTGIESLLGINLLTRLQDDLADLIFKKTKAQKDSEFKVDLEAATTSLNSVKRDIKQQETDKATLVAQLESLNDKLVEAEGRLKENGADLFLHRKEIEASLASANEEIGKRSSELVELAAGVLPLALVSDLLSDLHQQDAIEIEAKRAKAVLSILEERDIAAIELIAKDAPDAAKKLDDLFVNDREQRAALAKTEAYLNLSAEARDTLASISQQILYEKGVAASLTESYQDQIERRDIAERQLSMVPPEEVVVEGIKERDDIRVAISSTRHLITLAERKLDELQGSLRFRTTERNRVLKRIANEDAEGAIENRVVQYAEIARERVGRFSGAVLDRSLSHLESLILESLGLLLRKEGFVHSVGIEKDTFELQLFTDKGDQIPLERLSAGERQLVIIAILWGLGRASGRPLPIIVDTPLGRLDSIHREHLADYYFPNVSHQTILLSTDTEITGKTEDSLKGFIGGSYVLKHDAKNHQTQIAQGYF
jgi:DNA sulfur modification protein DndD